MRSSALRASQWPISARFDNLRQVPGCGFELVGPIGEIVAEGHDDVLPALAEVEAAVGNGHYAGGFISYEAAPGLDPALVTHGHDPSAVPLVWFGLFSAAAPVPALALPDQTAAAGDRWRLSVDFDTYRDQVTSIREFIADGLTYQLNLTARLRSPAPGEVETLYRSLAHAQQSEFAALIDTGRHSVVSASPELFFEWRDDTITTRPMKGTIGRGRWPEEDQGQAATLAASPKDRAENVMIVDLLRNDLGRFADYGSVQVERLCALERFATVWQLTSTITARPRSTTTLADIFAALFPCGSVTGAPKTRTMELIARLEDSPRGVYCGAVGYLTPGRTHPHARFSVGIRTAVVDRASGGAEYGSGGGIVWDSTAESEYDELRLKARILTTSTEAFDLIETMRFHPVTGIDNLARHLARMEASAAYFGFRFSPAETQAYLLDELSRRAEAARVRLTLSSSGQLTVDTAPLPAADAGPVRLAVDTEPVSSADRWLFHKTTRREPYRQRAERHPQADDIIITNERGEVTETTIANLTVRLAGRWVTPPLSAGCLPGVERARLVDLGVIAERTVTVAELEGAEALGVISSLRGWRPAVVAADS